MNNGENCKYEYLPGFWTIIKEHKFTLILILMVAVPLIASWGFSYRVPKGEPWADVSFLIYTVAFLILGPAVLIFEMPRSRYRILKTIGTLAWGYLFLSALLMGFTRWAEF